MDKQVSHNSTCPECGKLLTKPIVKIENKSLSTEDFNKFRDGVKVEYGAETKCRKCKRVRETLTEAR